jgi:uncharacterized protein
MGQVKEGLQKANHRMTLFFFIAFAISWPIWTMMIVNSLNSQDGMGTVLDLIAKFGPTISALVLTSLLGGRAAFKKILGTLLKWRVNVKWYLIVIIGPFVLMSLTIILESLLFGTTLPSVQILGGLVNFPLVYLFVLFANGPLQEELGWRGYELPSLQKKHNPLESSLILGALWGLWHLPLFFMPGTPQRDLIYPQNIALALIGFMAYTIAFTIALTWVFNKTKGSVFIAMLFHASANSALGVPALLLGIPLNSQFFLLFGILMAAWAIAVVLLSKSFKQSPFLRDT